MSITTDDTSSNHEINFHLSKIFSKTTHDWQGS
jgi:hypothetical protein